MSLSILQKIIDLIPLRPMKGEISASLPTDRYSDYPSNGLTPQRLARIFKEADGGDVLRQMELFEEMEEKDPHLFSQLQTRKNAVTGLDYEIIPFSESEEDKRVAEFVKRELESVESFEDIMMDLLDAIGKGIAVSEIIWECDGSKVSVGEIKSRHQKRLLWDVEDRLRITTREYPAGLLLPENKFIIHRYKARSGHPARAGVLRVTAWMYLFKNYDVKDWVSFCEVFGMPLRLGKYSPSSSEADKAALMQALVSLGTDAAGIIPIDTEIDFKEAAKVSSINLFESLARYCDEQTSKAILGQTLTSDSGGGSFAQSKTHNEVRHDLTVADCKAVAGTLRRDLIGPLVLFNFGSGVNAPYLRYDCEEADDLKETADIYEKLICNIGLKVSSAHVYKKFSIPQPDVNDDIIIPPGKTQQLPFKLLSTKSPVQGKHTDDQQDIEDITAAAIRASSGAFDKMFAPVLKMLDEKEDLNAVRATLEDNNFVETLYNSMDVSDFEQLLQRAMFFADLTGRRDE